jgi:hypothetical protein
MEQLQRILVADRVRELEHEAAALRAERLLRDPDARHGQDAGARRRFGGWLIGVGEAIAGRPKQHVTDGSDAMTNSA